MERGLGSPNLGPVLFYHITLFLVREYPYAAWTRLSPHMCNTNPGHIQRQLWSIWSSCSEEIFTEVAEGKIVAVIFFFPLKSGRVWTVFSSCLKEKGVTTTPQPPLEPQPSWREPTGLFVKKKKCHSLDSDGSSLSLLSPFFFFFLTIWTGFLQLSLKSQL